MPFAHQGFFRLGNAGWYVVKKGTILFRTFSFCCNFLNEILGVASSLKAHFEVGGIAIE